MNGLEHDISPKEKILAHICYIVFKTILISCEIRLLVFKCAQSLKYTLLNGQRFNDIINIHRYEECTGGGDGSAHHLANYKG